MTALVWFRQDLRTRDNPALARAARRGSIVPVFVLDETAEPSGRPPGGAARWWLHHSLDAFARSLGGLVLRRGDPRKVLPELVRESGATAVYWNRCYDPHAIARDTALKTALDARGIEVHSLNGGLLHEPWELQTGQGGPFKVYSPFWRACLKRPVAAVLPAPRTTLAPCVTRLDRERLEDWALLPARPDWAAEFSRHWTPGEAGARKGLNRFLADGLRGYAALRDRPDLTHTSRLSPHLHWGELSPRQVWSATCAQVRATPGLRIDADKFLAELGWREFAHHLLYHFPDLPHRNWKREFDAYPWQPDAARLRAWQRGRTGYPFVDAGMRELWTTGFLHNRVRMVAASFLVKHLRQDWRTGERWFWDTLLDADLANNAAGWQWVAGSGADASPYFRIFNPVSQGCRFDPDGDYVRRWCPELAGLPTEHLHAPFEAPEEVLRHAGVRLGATYPAPIVHHATAREAALRGYEAVKTGRPDAGL
ncbi:MAG TPA: deoxyribodipyrimidine photo-lyase [Steroidobacteraceae bacterium]|nr:deoxyribodipyrimidine photo-lyase [Steroidobacteraceae bacterium]